MELPSQLKKAIDQAREEMNFDSHHSLLPKQRLPIYQAMENIEEPLVKKWRAWLAILTARFVVPVWQKYMPDDNLAERIIEVRGESSRSLRRGCVNAGKRG